MNAAGDQCGNCGERLAGRYCHACGQKRIEPEDRRFGHLLAQFVESLTNLDSRFWRSLRTLLFKPGRLSAEYLAGRRARYMAPVTLFLIANVLYFLAPGITDLELPFVEHIDGPLRVELLEESRTLTPQQRQQIAARRAQWHSPVTGSWVVERVARRDSEVRAARPDARYTLGDYQRAYDQRRGEISRLLVILHVPVLALLLLLAQPRHGLSFSEHFVVALHLLAFVIFFVELAILPGSMIAKASGVAEIPPLVKLGSAILLIAYASRTLQVVYRRPLWLAIPVACLVLASLGIFSVVVYRALQFVLIFALT